MSTVMDIFDLAKTLSESDRARLTDLIANKIEKNENKNEVLTEKRFSDGVFCPRCNNSHIKRNGHKGTVQRYLCMDFHNRNKHNPCFNKERFVGMEEVC